MLKRRAFRCFGVAAVLLAASCAAPPPKGSGSVISAEQNAVLAIVKERALAYPDLTMSNFHAIPSRTSACALIRMPGKQPHVVWAWVDDDELKVSAPYLIEPGSWDDARNRALSDGRAHQCAEMDIPLPTE